MHDPHHAVLFHGREFLRLGEGVGERLFHAAALFDDGQFPLAREREHGLDLEERARRCRHRRHAPALFEVEQVVGDDAVLDVQGEGGDGIKGLLQTFARAAQAHRLFDQRPAADGRRQRVYHQNLRAGVFFFDAARGVLGDVRRGRKAARKAEMDDLLPPFFDDGAEMLEMLFVIEHGRARKAAFAQLAVKIDVFAVALEVVGRFRKGAVLFHDIAQADDADALRLYIVCVQVAGGIG